MRADVKHRVSRAAKPVPKRDAKLLVKQAAKQLAKKRYNVEAGNNADRLRAALVKKAKVVHHKKRDKYAERNKIFIFGEVKFVFFYVNFKSRKENL